VDLRRNRVRGVEAGGLAARGREEQGRRRHLPPPLQCEKDERRIGGQGTRRE